MAKYSCEFKRKVVKDYINNKGGYKYLANKYKLSDKKSSDNGSLIIRLLAMKD